MSRAYKPRLCPCGNEIGFGRNSSKFCSEKCHDIYGVRDHWHNKDTSPETKAICAKNSLKWAQDKTIEQLVDWYKRR